jgi:hypothetical protein
MTRDGATVHWTGNGPFFGQTVLDAAELAQNRLTTLLPLDYITPYDIYVYPSSADLRAGLKLSGMNDQIKTHPELDTILVTSVNPQTAVNDLELSVPYQLTHLLLYRAAGDFFPKIPWWLTEGMAVSVQGSSNPRQEQILQEAVDGGSTIPFWRLCNEPDESKERTNLASVQSASLVEFIITRYGDLAFIDLIAAYSRGDDCEVGTRRVLNKSLDDLYNAWLSAYNAPSPINEFVLNYGLWLIVIAAIIIFGVLLIWISTHGRN